MSEATETALSRIRALPPGAAHLALDECELTAQDIASLMPHLSCLKGLTSLDLGGNGIGDAGAQAVAAGLKGLTSLDLWGNGIGDAGAQAVAAGLKGLTCLRLAYNRIGAAGAQAVAAGLKGLTSLDLGGNGIGDAGAQAVAAGLKGLTSLHLGYTRIGDAGAQAVAAGLKGLTSLGLWGNRIGDAGAQAVAAGLKGLTSLDLGENENITDVSLVAFADGPARDTLKELRLSGTGVRSLPAPLIASGDAQAIFAEIRTGGRRPLREFKLLIVGEGGAGKSHVRHWLLEDPRKKDAPPYYSKAHLSTHNVEVQSWRVDAKLSDKEPEPAPTLLRVWDFGGQVNLHATHRFFLDDQRGLFLLVVDATRSVKWNRLHYWLRYTRHYTRKPPAAGENEPRPRRAGLQRQEAEPPIDARTPIILVLTKCDRTRDVNEETIALAKAPVWKAIREETGANIVGVVNNLGWNPKNETLPPDEKSDALRRHREAVDRLRELIVEFLPCIVGASQKFVPAFFKLKDWAEHTFATMQERLSGVTVYIEKEKYHEACEEAGLDEALREIYLLVLRSLGLLHYVGDRIDIRGSHELERILFNPHWVKWPVYQVLRARREDHRGGLMTSRSIHQRMDCLPGENANVHPEEELARKYFQEFRPDPKYKTKVIQLMKACELIFHLEGTDEYLVPDLLDDGNVPGGATTRSTNRDSLRLACDFLPEAKFLSFIGQCYLAGWIEDPAAECLRHGVLLTYDRARVLVRAIPGAKANEASIEVIPQGKPADNEFKDRIWGVLSSRMNLEKISANVRIAAAKNFDEMIKDEVNMAILKICRECPTITQKELRIKLKSLGLVSPVFNLGTLSRRIISLRECADREQISIPRLPGRKQ